MKAMILAAGFGTRLFPLTIDRTKPAIPFLGKPLVGYVAEYVAKFGFKDIIVNLHHQPDSVSVGPIAWGLSASDFPTQGDYDGDGKTDIAIWRPNADVSLNYFWVRNSSNGATMNVEWGQQGDYPVANYNSH